MLKVLIDCNEHPAIFGLPHYQSHIGDYLLAAGFWNPYADLCLLDDDNPDNVQVKLITETDDDNYLQSVFKPGTRLSVINTVCDLFYKFPPEQQADMIDSISKGFISDEKSLLDTIKTLMPDKSHDLPAIVFSRVKLWTDTGEECEFFIGGVPKEFEDIEENDDFEDFVKQISTTDTKEITAYITTFSEGEGETQPASQTDIDRIYNAIADVDIDTITGWNWVSDSQFSFDYDIDELFNMKDSEADEQPSMTGIE